MLSFINNIDKYKCSAVLIFHVLSLNICGQLNLLSECGLWGLLLLKCILVIWTMIKMAVMMMMFITKHSCEWKRRPQPVLWTKYFKLVITTTIIIMNDFIKGQHKGGRPRWYNFLTFGCYTSISIELLLFFRFVLFISCMKVCDKIPKAQHQALKNCTDQ